MTEERSKFAQRIDERKFSPSRRGYDKREVQDYLEDLEQAFREIEGHSRRTAQRVVELERDLSKAKATERVSVDNAMMAVFDAKDRILERARRRADEIEEDARNEAGRIREATLAEVGGADGSAAGEIAAARAQADEIVAAARREADRVRTEGQETSNEELEAELTALSAQVRRAHDDTASVKDELQSARNRIVQLENEAPSEDLERRFAEIEVHLRVAKEEEDRLRSDLITRDEQVEALSAAVTAAEEALGQSKAYVAETESALAAKETDLEQIRGDLDTARAELDAARATQLEGEGVVARVTELEGLLGVRDEELGALKASAAEVEVARATLDGELRSKNDEFEAAKTAFGDELEALKIANAEIEAAKAALGDELGSVQEELEAVKQQAFSQNQDLEELRAAQEQSVATADALAVAEAKLEDSANAGFADQMSTIEATLAKSLEEHEAASLVAEQSLAEAKARIAALESQLGESETSDIEGAKSEADKILAAARAEAEAIEADAEEMAEQRAAKVIATAREEADQVRQTVAELTAQADDARSAALRSKLEAEDLAEAQRSIGDARDDIVASAKTQAEELEQAAATRSAKAEEALAQAGKAKAEAEQARAEAELAKSESEEQARAIIAAAEAKATRLIEVAEVAAVADADAEDDLAALLAETEQEVAMSEELRRQREELNKREQEVALLERSVADKQEEAAMLLASARESAASVSGVAPPQASRREAEPPAPFTPSVDLSEGGDSGSNSDDPADRLSALLEQVAPAAAEVETDGEEPVDLDRLSEELDNQPLSRMAWPTPADSDSGEIPVADLEDADEDVDEDLDDETERESRYRSRSAGLPRLGSQAKSNMATMANLRKKSRGSND